MANPARCHACDHRAGPRALSAVVHDEYKGSQHQPDRRLPAGRTRKAPCGCACHQPA
jgi:hypothetical protein